MNFYTSGLIPPQLNVIKSIGACLIRKQFYLAGGTALAIYFGHRQSVDLDWFAPDLPEPLELAQTLRDCQIPFITDQSAENILHGSIESVRVSFLKYSYPLLQPVTPWPEQNISLASLDDLACMKLSAVAQRGSRKDFIDVYALIKNHKPLAELLSLFQQKYQVQNITSVLMSLVYFDDAEREPDPPLWKEDWRVVKRQLTAWVKAI